MNDSPIRVMLVDDQELIRTGFRLVLLSEPGIVVVAEAADGQQALDELERLEAADPSGIGCDIALMDVRMPGMNGIVATERIVAEHTEVRVLVLTTFDLDEYAVGAIQAGASGFLLKDARPTELVDAIRRVAAGDAAMAPSVTKRLMDQLRISGSAVANAGGSTVETGNRSTPPAAPDVFAVLTEREQEVLRLISGGMNNAEISGELFLSESTVKTHVGRVLSKLHLRDRVHAVIFAQQHGL